MFDILQEILHSHPFLKSQKFKMQGCQWYGVKGIKFICLDKGKSSTRLGHLFITSSTSSSYFFNKTNLEQYLYKVWKNAIVLGSIFNFH